MNRADLKQRAKAQLGGSIFGSVWLYAVLVFFINALIQLVGGQIPLLGRVVGLLLTGPLRATASPRCCSSRAGTARP